MLNKLKKTRTTLFIIIIVAHFVAHCGSFRGSFCGSLYGSLWLICGSFWNWKMAILGGGVTNLSMVD
jgi:hypothetical protein